MFTSTPLAGNGLAVVHDADELDDATMLGFARETKLSETTFVQSAAQSGADYRNRIWMTTGELQFAGHPSLGTAVAVARARGESAARYVQQTRAGLQPIEVELEGRAARASMLQEPAEHGPELPVAEVFAALGLREADSAPDLPPQVVSTGVAQVIAPLAGSSALDRCRPDAPALEALLAKTGAITLYAVVCDAAAGTARARSFFPGTGETVVEDPATGSAAGPLAAYMHERMGTEVVTVRQGIEMGRPSRLDTSIEGDRVRVGGDVVILAEGVIDL